MNSDVVAMKSDDRRIERHDVAHFDDDEISAMSFASWLQPGAPAASLLGLATVEPAVANQLQSIAARVVNGRIHGIGNISREELLKNIQ